MCRKPTRVTGQPYRDEGSVQVRRVDHVTVIVVDVRERPDQRVRHEDRAGDDDREGDDESPVHGEPPLVQLRTSSRTGSAAASGNAVIAVAAEPQLRAILGPTAEAREGDGVYVGMTTTRGTNEDMVGLARISGEMMAPWLREIEGFEGLLMLSSQETGVTQVITFWASREVAEKHREARRSLRDRITSTVDVEVQETADYELAFADVPSLRSS